MPPVLRRRLLRQQWPGNFPRRVPRGLAARWPPRKTDLLPLWRPSHSGSYAALGGGSQPHAENVRPCLADDACRFLLPHTTITFLAGDEQASSRERERHRCTYRAILAPSMSPPSAGGGTCEQILDDCADLQELIKAGRLGDEAGDSKVREQSLISPGLGRTPRANRNAGEVFRCPNLA